MSNQEVQRDVALKKIEALEGKKDELIEKVETFFRQRREQRQRPVPKNFGSQLQNLVRLAESTQSVKEVCLFIRYQMGRHKEWREGGFGEQLLSVLGDVVTIPASDLKPIDLVRLFLGYLQREAVWQEELSSTSLEPGDETVNAENDEGGGESESS